MFAGIKSAYDPAELAGRHVVMVANLKPRKMRLAFPRAWCCVRLTTIPGCICFLEPDEGANPGSRVT